MGRKRRHEDQEPQPSRAGDEHRPRRGRKLAVLLALAGAAAYLLRRNQRRAELDEGIWHEAPTPSTQTA